MNKMNNNFVVKTVVGIFCLTWLMWGSIIIANQFGYIQYGTPLSLALFIIGAIAPAVVPVVFILKNKIMPAKQLLKTIFAVKQRLTLYLLVAVFMVMFVITGTLSGLFTPFSPVYLLMFPVLIFIGGLEELGWRFVLQSSLEKKVSFTLSSSIIALIWAVWHLPLFFIEGRIQYDWNFGLYLIFMFGLAFPIAAVYRISKSVWLCVLLHALFSTIFEDSSLVIRFNDFSQDIVPVFITSAVLVVVSITIVRIANTSSRRNKI
jgi:membrane protease YdiL (CAAX protease family)